MKKQISLSLFLLIGIGTISPAYGQDSITSISPQIIKEVVIKETKVKIVRDTVVMQSDSVLSTSFQTLNHKVDSIKEQQKLALEQQKVLVDSIDDNMKVLKWIIGIGMILTLAIIICLIQLLLQIRRFLKDHDVKPTQAISDEKLDDENSGNSEDTKPEKPTLDAYNASVYEFTTINDHVSNLRRKDTKPLVMAMYRYLSLRSVDKAALLSDIRSSTIPEDAMEQFVALVSRMETFFIQKKPIIDAWLYWEPKDGVDSYESAIRMPEGLIFSENLDEEVLGDNIVGQQISMVHKLGFYFPGNTIKPYRVKSIVSA